MGSAANADDVGELKRLFSPALTPRQNTILTHLANWYTNTEALCMATSGNADLLELSSLRTPYAGKLGVIEEGAFADMLVWDGNPLDYLRTIEIRNGS
ncbi:MULTISPECIES: hypothetical protein [Rhizobium]|uniref:Amidohydrolase n=1 Tax=Rhizobium favelukesii TaxID=348824 RepID=W6RND7_9HYPH|nr:putative amidohydrolase [Rhizobium favelukesii]